jgi:hypothetical protein
LIGRAYPYQGWGAKLRFLANAMGHVKVLIFKVIDRGGESHGGCDGRFEMVDMCIGGDEDGWHRFLPVCRVFGLL